MKTMNKKEKEINNEKVFQDEINVRIEVIEAKKRTEGMVENV